jgi:cytoskeletal protein CcmA (bactofilin family)
MTNLLKKDVTKTLSVVAKNVVITGNIHTDGIFQLDGQLIGDFHGQSLTIGESGSIKGNIQVNSLQNNGRVDGSIWVKQANFTSCARINGDVNYCELNVESGCLVNGSYKNITTEQISEKLALNKDRAKLPVALSAKPALQKHSKLTGT